MKKITPISKLTRRVYKTILVLGAFLSVSIAGFNFSVVHAQTLTEAVNCHTKYSGKVALNAGVPGTVSIDGFRDSGCEYKNAKGNCSLFDQGDAQIIYCSSSPDTKPSAISESLNDPEKCVKREDLSFDWGVDCVSTAGLINVIFNILAGLVGVAVVAGITWGGMLYTTSNGNAAKAQQGITVIVNSVIGLLLFIFLFAITNFLVPGGIFKG